ncbi:MAG: hypothetical protein F4X26_09860 [Chloroflexi bacterium]|nr:hypothetical protein [Chloroflexota bacterium]
MRALAEHIPKQHPDVRSIADVTPDVYQAWVNAAQRLETWPNRIRTAKAILEGAEGLPAETLRAVKATRAREPRESAEGPYGIRDLVRIRRAARRRTDAVESRIGKNRDLHNLYLSGQEPPDALRVRVKSVPMSMGQILDCLHRTVRMPQTWHGSSRKKQLLVRAALHLPPRERRYQRALFPTKADIYAIMLGLACEKGLNAAPMLRLRLSDIHQAGTDRTGRAVYTVQLDKPRSGSQRNSPSIFAGRASRLLEQAIFITQGVRDARADLGDPTDRLLVAAASIPMGHEADDMFSASLPDLSELSRAWHEEEEVLRKDGSSIDVKLRRVRKTYQGLTRRASQNSQEVHERDYVRNDPRIRELARREIEQAQVNIVADAGTVAGIHIGSDDLATARANPEAVAGNRGLRPSQLIDVIEGKLDTNGGVACKDIFHSPHPQDDGGICTASPVDCAGCPNSISTPDHLPMQLAILEVLEARAAAVFGTPHECDFDVYVIRYRSLIGRATAAEVEQARRAVTPQHISIAERLVRGDFDVWHRRLRRSAIPTHVSSR